MLKKLTLMIFSCIFVLQDTALAQTYNNESLQRTYWNYRDLFRKNYTHIGIEHGKSIPFEGLHEIDVIRTVNPGHADIHGRIDYGDANITHGYYLAVLATEFKLLINSNPIDWEAVTACCNELYFALEAINRIDQYSNLYFDQFALFPSQPLDGFLTRGDVTKEFFQWGLEDKAGYTRNYRWVHSDLFKGVDISSVQQFFKEVILTNPLRRVQVLDKQKGSTSDGSEFDFGDGINQLCHPLGGYNAYIPGAYAHYGAEMSQGFIPELNYYYKLVLIK